MSTKTPQIVCPKCRKGSFHRSRRQGFKDRVLSLLGRLPVRCDFCENRWYVNANNYGVRADS